MPIYSVNISLIIKAKDKADAEAEFYKLISMGEYDSDSLVIKVGDTND